MTERISTDKEIYRNSVDRGSIARGRFDNLFDDKEMEKFTEFVNQKVPWFGGFILSLNTPEDNDWFFYPVDRKETERKNKIVFDDPELIEDKLPPELSNCPVWIYQLPAQ